MKSFHAGWHLIYTRPRHEKKVSARLTELSINCYLPTKKVLRTWHDRRKYVDEPLFPSYVFIYLNDMKSYYGGMDAEGALYYVRCGSQIALVNDAVVNNIKIVSGQVGEVEVSASRYQPGRRMVITQGALTGLSCEVVQINNKHKLLVRVDLLQRNLLVNLPVESLMEI